MAAPEKYVALALGALSCAAAATPAVAEALRAPETLVVTGMRERPLAELPRSAVVIDAADIALAPALTIPELLADEANITLRSVTGNDRFSGIDIRGQGDTYTSNVVVMVDGVRINNEDLSGADYSIVPLDRVERVEVIRGASTVRYGNGAVGGVVNIITREPSAGLGMTVSSRAGSYGSVESGVDAAFGADTYFAALGASYFESDGYRDNGELSKRDVSGEVGLMPAEWLSVSGRADLHDDEYGLPGPVSEDDFFGSAAERRASRFPDDGGTTEDDRYRLQAELGTPDTGVVKLVGLTRDRVNEYVLAETPGAITEDSERFDAQYTLDVSAFGRAHTLYAGATADQADYSRITDFTQPDDPSEVNVIGSLRHKAWFLAADAGLTDTLLLSLGYRADSFRVRGVGQEFVSVCDVLFGTPPNQLCLDPGGFRNEIVSGSGESRYRSSAFEAGLVYSPTDRISWFLAYARSFRNPNIDELVLADDDLGPQKGEHWDAGLRVSWNDLLETSVALFRVETDDEILFAIDSDFVADRFVGSNFNAEEPTERLGGEADVTWYALPSLQLSANVGYTKAEFKDSGRTLPLVPEWTAGIRAQQQFTPDLTLTVTANHVGSRYDGNDFGNNEPKLDSYQVVDARLVYERDELSLYAGVGNLFDEVYATSVYSSNYYPMPDRNFYAGFSIAFQST